MPRPSVREGFLCPCGGTRKDRRRTARLLQLFDQTCDSIRVRTAYRCRAYPDEAQQQVLTRTFGCVRVVWNRALAERHRLYHQPPAPGAQGQEPGPLSAAHGPLPARLRQPGQGQRRKSPAPTGRCAMRAGTSCTAPAPAWSAPPA
ncbi:MAG TPA: helix-turn-helix domain-containing protein [Streptosporangiaceae bacterium]|nr:helix-turn-helix domain-containing protein [Streptosporangiaceae bacterium]